MINSVCLDKLGCSDAVFSSCDEQHVLNVVDQCIDSHSRMILAYNVQSDPSVKRFSSPQCFLVFLARQVLHNCQFRREVSVILVT